jgi:hypothetical protein
MMCVGSFFILAAWSMRHLVFSADAIESHLNHELQFLWFAWSIWIMTFVSGIGFITVPVVTVANHLAMSLFGSFGFVGAYVISFLVSAFTFRVASFPLSMLS